MSYIRRGSKHATIVQPDIHLFGIRLQEPVTTLTDFIVGFLCFYAYWRLQKQGKESNTILYMKWYFLTMGAATCFGGIFSHGFLYYFGEQFKLVGWFISMLSIMLIERASIEHARAIIPQRLHQWLLAINLVELLIFATLAAVTINFRYVEIHSAYGLLGVVFTFHLLMYRRLRDRGSRLILYAVGVLGLAVFAYNYPINPHVWFNRTDLSHILMAVATILILRGAERFGERERD